MGDISNAVESVTINYKDGHQEQYNKRVKVDYVITYDDDGSKERANIEYINIRINKGDVSAAGQQNGATG